MNHDLPLGRVRHEATAWFLRLAERQLASPDFALPSVMPVRTRALLQAG